MILLVVAVIFSSCVEARLARTNNPLQALRLNLALLERKCDSAFELAKGGIKTGTCAKDFVAAVKLSAEHCRKIHALYSESTASAEQLIVEALLWRSRKTMLRDDGKTVSISFSLSGDPTYPFHKSDRVVNDALQGAYRSLSIAGNAVNNLQKNKLCKSRGAKAEVEKLWQEWEGDRSGESMSDFHNALGMGVSDYLMNARRGLESGAHDEAVKGMGEALK